MRQVTLYTRRGCGLCEEAARELRRLQSNMRFELTEIDVDDDAGLIDRFNDVVPVITVDGEVLAQAPLAPLELEDILIRSFPTI